VAVILRGSPKRLAPPATTAKPLRRDDGSCMGTHSRDATRLSFAKSLPSKDRGRREDRVRAAPAVSCAMCTKKCAHEHTGSAESIRPSLRNGFTAYSALSPATNSSCHRRLRIKTCPSPVGPTHLRKLGISNGCQDHTTSPYAATRLRQQALRALAPFVCALTDRSRETRPAIAVSRRRCRVHRISTRVRDDRDPPLVWVRRAELCP
jgi:hypothetical protein